MLCHKIVIPLTPKPKASVMLAKRKWVNPSAKGMRQTREIVQQALKEAQSLPIKGPVLCIVHFRVPVPAGVHSHVQRERRHCCPHWTRPDGDNFEKFLNDSLLKITWFDDSHIVWMLRSKSQTKEKVGSTVLYFQELDKGKPDYDVILTAIKNNIRIEDNDAIPNE